MAHKEQKRLLEAYDPMAPEVRADPYPYFRAFLDSGCPLHYHLLSRSDAERVNANPLVAKPTTEFWSVFAYDDVLHVLQHPDAFSVASGPGPERLIAPNGVGMLMYADPPHHTFQRRIVNKALTPRLVALQEPRIRRIADELIDTFVTDGQADIVSQFADLLPGTVFAGMLGVPEKDVPTFKQWAEEIVAAFGGDQKTQERSFEAMQELASYFIPIINERRAAGAAGEELPDDLLTALIFSDYQGRTFDDTDLFLALHILIIGGNETTSSVLGNAVYLLCTHPEQLQLLQANPSLLPNAIEEVLRYDTPVQRMFRTPNADHTLAGTTIPADAKIALCYGAANRDASVFDDPDRFDITRDAKTLHRHLGFGFGIHACVGTALGRAQLRIGLQALLERLPGLHLDPDREPVRGDTLLVRRFARLPIRFDSQPR